jgi:hypothetical protein
LFQLGNTSVSCTATDTHGNTSAAAFVVHVVDTTPPVLTVPGNITGVQATSSAGAVVTYTATATDVVDASPSVVCLAPSGSTFGILTSTVSCTATDDYGNTSAARTFSVTVIDTLPPIITVPSPITRSATSLSGAVVTYTVSAVDLVDGARPVTCVPASGATFPMGTTTVNCSASDTRGNTATKSFTVTVQLQYGFVAVQNLPPPPGKTFKPGSSVPLKWQFTMGGVAVNSTASNPKITITGPGGAMSFTATDPGKSSFQPPTAANGWTWQFNWQTVTATGANLPTGIYSVSITSQQTNQTFSGGNIQLK